LFYIFGRNINDSHYYYYYYYYYKKVLEGRMKDQEEDQG